MKPLYKLIVEREDSAVSSASTDISPDGENSQVAFDEESQGNQKPINEITFLNDREKFVHSLRGVKKLKNTFYVRQKYIKHGYRAHQQMSYCKCAQSLFMLHNETLNVWTHLASGLYYIWQLYLIITASGGYEGIQVNSNRFVIGFACMTCIFCMLSSATYHLFNSLNRSLYYSLLKFDLIGIGLNITGLAITLIYTGFHIYSTIGITLVLTIGLLMTLNLFLQITPCYMQDKYDRLRTLFYVVLITILFGVAVGWTVFIATGIEINLFFLTLMKSFIYIGIGFFFYATKYPEKISTNYYVQMLGQAHIWWHVFVFLNGFTLYWLLYDALLHCEKYTSLQQELQ